jgi:DNA polymerase I
MIVSTKNELDNLLKVLSQGWNHVVLDTETTITDSNWNKSVIGVAVYIPAIDQAYYLSFKPDREYGLKLQNILLKSTLIFHNAKFDIQMLMKWYIDLRACTFEDTMLMSYVIDEEPPHGLKELTAKFLGPEAKKEQEIVKTLTKAFTWEGIPTPIMARYAEQDVRLTWQLFENLHVPAELVEVLQKDYKFMRVLLEIELEGISIDPVEAKLKSSECIKRMYAIENMLGYDPAKPSQLANRLYSPAPTGLGLTPIAYGMPSKAFPKGRPKMGVAELTEHHHPEVGLVLEYRRVQKAKSTWYDGWLEVMSPENKIHPTFHQHSTVTSRLSCSNPNMQQIPRDSEETETKAAFPIKKLIRADPGCSMYELDYSQVELRLAAVYANETTMLQVFKDNGDPHQLVADTIGVSRFIGKTINFLTLYGGGAGKLQWVLKQAGSNYTQSQCESFMYDFHAAYPGFKQCMWACTNAMVQRGWIQYWSGRRRRMKFDQHKAFNSLIQGGAAEIMRESLIQISEASLPVKLKSQVHDSLWVQISNSDYDSLQKVKELMEWPSEEFGIPFPVDIKMIA